MSRFIPLFTMLVLTQPIWALTDPTQPAAYIAPSATKAEFELTSVLVSGQRKVAVINGRVVAEGDQLGKAKVTRIEKQQVLLSSGGKMIKLVPQRTAVRQEK